MSHILSVDGERVPGEPLAALNSVGIAPPRCPVPVGAVDAHHHIYDPRFPETSGKTRDVGTVKQYLVLRRRLGLARSVVVAPNTYNRDNNCLLDALDLFADTARGVAIVSPDASDDELANLHARGVRGIRLYLTKNPWPADAVRAMAARLSGLGWHIELQPGSGEQMVAARDLLADLPCPLVIDHFGYVPQPDGLNHAAAGLMLDLARHRDVWVKLSGRYYTSQVGFPSYADLDGLAEALIAAAPDHMLWGSDWPHTNKVFPDDARALDDLYRWCGSRELYQRILVDNPGRLYWNEQGGRL